jgi:hypothetical protein
MCSTCGNRALIAGAGIDNRLCTYPDSEARRAVTSGADIDCDTDPDPDTWNSG